MRPTRRDGKLGVVYCVVHERNRKTALNEEEDLSTNLAA